MDVVSMAVDYLVLNFKVAQSAAQCDENLLCHHRS